MKFKNHLSENQTIQESRNPDISKINRKLKDIGLELDLEDENKPIKQISRSSFENWKVVVNSSGREVTVRPSGPLVQITGNFPPMTHLTAKKQEMKDLSESLGKAQKEFEYIRERLALLSRFSF